MYAARSAAVSVTLDGADNDGESGERDQVRLTTESLKTGSGNDRIDSRDGVKGNISCGAGNDVVAVDQDDTVANDCEEAVIGAASVCTIGPSLVNMNKKGSIRIKVSLPAGWQGHAEATDRRQGQASQEGGQQARHVEGRQAQDRHGQAHQDSQATAEAAQGLSPGTRDRLREDRERVDVEGKQAVAEPDDHGPEMEKVTR